MNQCDGHDDHDAVAPYKEQYGRLVHGGFNTASTVSQALVYSVRTTACGQVKEMRRLEDYCQLPSFSCSILVDFITRTYELEICPRYGCLGIATRLY